MDEARERRALADCFESFESQDTSLRVGNVNSVSVNEQSSLRLLTVGYFGLIRRIFLTYHVTVGLVDMESCLSGFSDRCVCVSRCLRVFNSSRDAVDSHNCHYVPVWLFIAHTSN